jgi:hypothetical protein
VSLLDGTLVAVEPDSGRLLWTFDSGSPLVSASGSAEVGAGLVPEGGGPHATAAPAQQGRAIFPGVDGALYSYKKSGALGRGLEVKIVLFSSPLMDPNGAGLTCMHETRLRCAWACRVGPHEK